MSWYQIYGDLVMFSLCKFSFFLYHFIPCDEVIERDKKCANVYMELGIF